MNPAHPQSRAAQSCAAQSCAVQAMREPSVAVIVVTYRTAALTIAALRSLAAERASAGFAIRAVVVDNASGDVAAISQAVAANDWCSWVSLITAPRNGGFGYGNNLGIKRAYAQAAPSYVYLLNPDAEARSGAIRALIDFLESHPEAGIAGSSFENPDGTEWNTAFRFPGALSELCDGLSFSPVARLLSRWRVPMEMDDEVRCVDWISGASMMIRAQVLAAIGGFDERYFLYFEETDFCLRARRSGFSTWYVPQSRVMHRRGQSTGVTDLSRRPARLPAYWFESRRRYFATSVGLARATMIDAVALLANGLGWLKSRLRHRGPSRTPHFTRDLLRHSLLRPGNRALPAADCGNLGPLVRAALSGARGELFPGTAMTWPSERPTYKPEFFT